MDDLKALEIYKITKSEEATMLNLHRQYSHQYFTLVAVIFGVTLGVIYQFKGNLWLMLALFAPFLNILICTSAIRTCNRFYQRFLEGITILIKLEPFIGLTSPRPNKTKESESLPFPEDKKFLPERWLDSRKQAKATEFVEENMKSGSNRLVRISFYVLIFANVVIAIATVVCSF